MTLEERRAKILINKAGGTAGPEGKSYRVVLPPVWAKQLGVMENSRDVILQFDGECITIAELARENIIPLSMRREKKARSIDSSLL